MKLEYEELEYTALRIRHDLIRKFGNESVGDRIMELLRHSPVLLFLEGDNERAYSVAGMLHECIRDARGMLAAQGQAV